MFKWLILWCCFVNFQVNFCLVCVSVCLVEEVLISTCLAAVFKLSKNCYWPSLSQRHSHSYKINKVYLSCESSKLCQFQHLKNVDNLFCLLWCPDFMFPPKTCLVPIQSNFGLSLCWRGCQFLPIHFSLTLSVAKVKSGLTSSAQQSLASSYQIQYFFHSLTQFATLTCFLSLFLSLLHAITHSLSLSLSFSLSLSHSQYLYCHRPMWYCLGQFSRPRLFLFSHSPHCTLTLTRRPKLTHSQTTDRLDETWAELSALEMAVCRACL